MFRSHYSNAGSGRSRSAWSLFGLAHTGLDATRERYGAYDPRPLGQRLDDEEDQLLIEHRRLMQRIRQVTLSVIVAALLVWLMS